MLVKYIFLLQTSQTNFLVLDFPGFGSASTELFSLEFVAASLSAILHSTIGNVL